MLKKACKKRKILYGNTILQNSGDVGKKPGGVDAQEYVNKLNETKTFAENDLKSNWAY